MPETEGGLVLVIEDDRNISALVERYLSNAGFRTLAAHDGVEGLDLARRSNPQLVVLDILLPGLDGLEVCRALRRDSDVPILMLTARADEMDRVVGFNLGADDYVVKPFSPRELVERVKAILRRARPPAAPQAAVLQRGSLTLDRQRHKLTVKQQPVTLTPSEFKLLAKLMSAPGRVFSRSDLLSELYQDGGAVVDRVVDVHIGKLRQKIEPDPSKPSLTSSPCTVSDTGSPSESRGMRNNLSGLGSCWQHPLEAARRSSWRCSSRAMVVIWLVIDTLAADYFIGADGEVQDRAGRDARRCSWMPIHRYLFQATIGCDGAIG